MSKLPKHINIGGGRSMPVEQKPLDGYRLGYLDTRTRLIGIKQDQPEAGKHLILLHELIHLVAENLKAKKLIKRQPDEKFVTNLAAGLFPILALSGLWNGVSKAQVRRFIKRHL